MDETMINEQRLRLIEAVLPVVTDKISTASPANVEHLCKQMGVSPPSREGLIIANVFGLVDAVLEYAHKHPKVYDAQPDPGDPKNWSIGTQEGAPQ